ncbi:MAG: hypothetical protein E6960_12010 [Clostridium sp.]|uniref:hypothetical protein n=1 Tax=Clostridium sp. TaxID=1506 RepID=UPI0028FEDB1E|nr:hypothetical protein [Clostridium sp.]MDU1279192.1 hypothetical protein [Clostridium sp.]
MEFITVEQFKEQSIEVQKVFLDWWKCDYGDLYYYNEYPLEYKDFEIIDSDLECDIEGDFDYFKSIGVIPIFTEGQLRKFIEDNTRYKIESNLYRNGYDIYLCEDDGCYIKAYESVDKDLLQAYWKVACMVAKEDLNE